MSARGALLAGCCLLLAGATAWGQTDVRPARQRPAAASSSVILSPSDPATPEAARISRDAQTLMRSGKFEEALALLGKIEKGQATAQILLLKGSCLRKLGRYQDARDLYRSEAEAAAARGEDPIPILIELERVLREAKDTEGAFQVCLEIHRAGGGAGVWVRDEIESLIEADSLGDRAVPALREEIRAHPETADLGDLLVGTLLFLGKDEEALREARSIDRSRHANGRVLLDQLRLIDKKGMGAPAVGAADAAIEEGLKGAELQEARYLRAGALRRMGQMKEAAAAYEEASNTMPGGPLAHVCLRDRADLLVRDLHDLEAGEKAQEALVQSLEKAAPAERGRLLGRALIDLADTRLRMGRYDDAASVCKQVEAEASDPSSKEEAVFRQAEILFYAGKTEEAQAAYERIVKEFGGGNRVNDALDRILLITRVSEAGAVSLAALGQIAYQRAAGTPGRALEICREAARACGNCAAAQDLLREESLLLLDLGSLEEAAGRADTLAVRFPDGAAGPAVLRAVADRMRERDGETETVMRRYEEILVRFPKSHEALEVRSLLEKLRRTGEAVAPREKEHHG